MCAQKQRQQKVPPARVISACPGSDTHRADECGTAEVERLLEQQVRQERTLLACGPAACDTGRHSGRKKKKTTLWRILHPFIQPLPYVQLCLVRKPCQHLKKKKKKMGENWTHEKMLHQTLVSLALVISTAIADPIC